MANLPSKGFPLCLALAAVPSFLLLLYLNGDFQKIDYPLFGVWPLNISTFPPSPKFCYSENESTIIFTQLSNFSNAWHPLESCAIRTAAIVNKQTGVCVLTKIDMMPDANLVALPNLDMAPLNISSVFEDTPLEGWYENYVLNSSAASSTVMWELSDALRYAYVYKYGGKYLDTDILSLRDFSQLRNVVARQGDGFINGAMFFFEPRHPFVRAALESFKKYFTPGHWGSVGPDLITKVHSNGSVNKSTYSVLDPSSFYPVHYAEFELPFKAAKKIEVEKLVARGSYGLHLWRYMFKKFSKMEPWKKGAYPERGSYLEKFLSDHCSAVA